MTKAERTVMRHAILQIMLDDGDFYAGMQSLCRLAGLTYPASEILRGVKAADFRKVASGPNQTFQVTK